MMLHVKVGGQDVDIMSSKSMIEEIGDGYETCKVGTPRLT